MGVPLPHWLNGAPFCCSHWTETSSSAVICLHRAAPMDSDWLSRTTWLGLDWSLAYWEVNNVSLMMAKAVSPLTFCTPLHTGRLMFFFNPSIYEYDNENCAYLCTVCVNSVPKCTVNSIFIFFFNLKKKKKTSGCHDHFKQLKNDFRVFWFILASCLSKFSLWALCSEQYNTNKKVTPTNWTTVCKYLLAAFLFL